MANQSNSNQGSNRKQSQNQADGRKDGQFGHGGLSSEEQRRAQSKGGQN